MKKTMLTVLLVLLLPTLAIAASSEDKLLSELKMLSKKINTHYNLPDSYKVDPEYNKPDFLHSIKRIGTWEITVGSYNGLIVEVRVEGKETIYSPSPGKKFEQAVSITEEILGKGADDVQESYYEAKGGSVETPSGIAYDFKSSNGTYVHTDCAAGNDIKYTWKNSSIDAHVSGAGGTKCTIRKTGSIGQSFNGAAYISLYRLNGWDIK